MDRVVDKQRTAATLVLLLVSALALSALATDGFRYLRAHIKKRPPRVASHVVAPGELSAAHAAALATFGRQVQANHSELWGSVAPCQQQLYGVGYGSHVLCAPSVLQQQSGCFYQLWDRAGLVA